jgi:transcriptional regulator with XRE-family HTH domain
MDDFLLAIEAERKAQGLSIRKMAALCGISRQYYHRLLNAEHGPTLNWCRRLAEPLGLELTLTKTAKTD